MTQTPDSGRFHRTLPFSVALAGSAYPILFERVAALGIGPYGGVAPMQWTRLGVAWLVSTVVLAVVAVVIWRFTGRPFHTVLVPATVVLWALAFTWRAALRLDQWFNLPGQTTIAIVLGLIVISGWLLLRISRSPDGATALMVAALIPIALTLWQGRALVALPSPAPIEADPALQAVPDRPSVWILVFDAMPSPEILAELDWDPTPFVAGLESQGFQVPDDATTVATGTYVTISAMLSLGDSPPSGDVSKHGTWLAAMTGSHPLAAALVADGYDYVMVDNAWSFTRCGDLVTDCRTRPLETDLEWVMLVNSIAAPFATDHGPWRLHSITQLDELVDLAREEANRPRLVTAHMLIPHQPFELAGDCSPRYGTAERPELEWLRTQSGFLEMMTCTANRIEELVAAIPDDDIVLIMGDHGSDLANAGSRYSADQLRDRLSTFVAVRGCDLASDYLTSNANAYRGVAGCVTNGQFAPWPPAPVIACVQLSGVAKLTQASEALAAGEGLDCRE